MLLYREINMRTERVNCAADCNSKRQFCLAADVTYNQPNNLAGPSNCKTFQNFKVKLLRLISICIFQHFPHAGKKTFQNITKAAKNTVNIGMDVYVHAHDLVAINHN